ncbi:MAG: hypothetical protein CMC76_03870 [Flavobacteriaceae bacterium]|nr:hypothetical protein [Flavobacteriaceae bacterium]MAX70226.1 hypothetical protein [Flavobacteriaceae bacterium]|tara:strand:+ start:4121 stop:4966 length:846 start_codon:yes stop_codon:yes gene_type:complete
MKNYIKGLLILTGIVFASCEDVIDVDVNNAEPRLVIEASLDWEKGTAGNAQTIKLSMSSPYFSTDEDTSVSGATVTVTNTNSGAIFNFVDENNGSYTIDNFVPVIGDTYHLDVSYNGENYEATETLMSVSDINTITQSIEGGFDDELLEVNVYFDDPVDEENYYLIRYYEDGDLFPYFEDISDEFVNGNEIHDFFEKDDDEDNGEAAFQPGDVVDIELYGISEQYYNYMRLLIEQYYSGGDPFSSNSALIRGNCINPTNPEQYAFGYFRLTQVNVTSYTFE